MRSAFFYILFLGLFTACSTISYIGVETYNPAEITFPEHVKKVIIVNNAVPQPPDRGYQYLLYNVEQETAMAHADSALFAACRALGTSIVERGYFEDVLLYHFPVREDKEYYADRRLTKDQIDRLCFENGADAIISLDRLLFDMKKNVTTFPEGFVVGMIDVKVRGIIRSYLHHRESAMATIIVNDSVFWGEGADNLILLEKVLPAADEALTLAAAEVAKELYPNFVPYWRNEDRWYYNGITTRWKEASAFAAAGKWEEAYERWSSIYERASGWKDKAKAASNQSLYYEMAGDLSKAYEWAVVSYDLFLKNKGKEYQYTQLQEALNRGLEERLAADNKLNVQSEKRN